MGSLEPAAATVIRRLISELHNNDGNEGEAPGRAFVPWYRIYGDRSISGPCYLEEGNLVL